MRVLPRRATRLNQAKRKLSVKKAKVWLEARRLTGQPSSSTSGKGGRVRPSWNPDCGALSPTTLRQEIPGRSLRKRLRK